jgi:hypothetical protein
MAKTILVVMKLQKNVELLLRRLGGVVKPGNRIVFLFEYQHDVPTWLLAHVTALQTGCDNGLAWQEQKAWSSWDEQKAQAEEIVGEPARRAFSRLGVEVVVDLYSRSVSATVKRYLETGDIALILVTTSSWLERLKIVPINVRNWLVRQLPQLSLLYSDR